MNFTQRLTDLKSDLITAVRTALKGVPTQPFEEGNSVSVLVNVHNTCKVGDTGIIDAIEGDVAHVLLDVPQQYNSYPLRFRANKNGGAEVKTTDKVLNLLESSNAVVQDGRIIKVVSLDVAGKLWFTGEDEERGEEFEDDEDQIAVLTADTLLMVLDAVTAAVG